MKDVSNWLLKGEPFVEYRARVDLLGQTENEPEVIDAKKRMMADQKIQLLLQELKNWPGEVLNSHKSASQPFHKLSFIADIGLTKEDPRVDAIAHKIFEHQSEEGPFELSTNVPVHFGGSGTDTWAWALCDAPVIIYSLAKFGFVKMCGCKKQRGIWWIWPMKTGGAARFQRNLASFEAPEEKKTLAHMLLWLC